MYLEKVKDLSSKYKYVRRTRPDGNCFFRAFSYANIERLIENREEFDSFYKLAQSSKDSLVELGFPQFTVEDFYDTVSVAIQIVCFSFKFFFKFSQFSVHGCVETNQRD